MPKSNPVEALSFEEALTELEQTVRQLEEGSLTLEETVGLYRRGRALSLRCQELLDDVELQVKQLVTDERGEETLQDFTGDS
ncbi:MAG: exodeoxyribonuclease VII small subunit [Anaerolineales bacterium]